MKVLMRADTHVTFNLPNSAPKAKCTLSQVFTALSVSLVSMVVGFVSSYTAPARETLIQSLQVDDNQYSWVGSLMPLGACIGGVAGGPFIDFIGRKRTIMLTTVLFFVSWLFIAPVTQIWYLYIGRAISGFAVGIASLVLPVYLGETLQPEVRGTLGLLPTGFGNIGMLLCFTVGNYLAWNHLAWFGAALPLIFITLIFLIPETPRWYISKGQDEGARKSLQWLRGKNANIEEEFHVLTRSQKESDESASSLSDLFSKAFLKPMLISLGLMLFQQMTGINAVVFYTTFIFKESGSTIEDSLCTIIVGIVNFVSAFLATALIDRLGRKILLYISNVVVIFTLIIMGIYFYLMSLSVDVSKYGWLPLASFVVYVLGFSLGFGPIPWLMMGEILPAKIRGSAASIATAFNWSCTFLVTKTFVNIKDVIGFHGTFWLFGAFSVVGLLFVFFYVPETRGQSLEDIERKLAGLEVRRVSSVANLKPLPSPL